MIISSKLNMWGKLKKNHFHSSNIEFPKFLMNNKVKFEYQMRNFLPKHQSPMKINTSNKHLGNTQQSICVLTLNASGLTTNNIRELKRLENKTTSTQSFQNKETLMLSKVRFI